MGRVAIAVSFGVPSLVSGGGRRRHYPVYRAGKQAGQAAASRRLVGKQAGEAWASRLSSRRRPALRPVRGVVRGVEGAFYRGRVRVGVRALCGSYGLYGGRGGALAVSVRRRMSWRSSFPVVDCPSCAPFRLLVARLIRWGQGDEPMNEMERSG